MSEKGKITLKSWDLGFYRALALQKSGRKLCAVSSSDVQPLPIPSSYSVEEESVQKGFQVYKNGADATVCSR
jgi:hypothetical protein